MEVVIASSLLGMGYLLNSEKNTRPYDQPKPIPNQKTVQYKKDNYQTNQYLVATTTERGKVSKNYKKAKNAIETNIVPHHFNDSLINEQTTSVQFLQRPTADRTLNRPIEVKESNIENFYEPLIQPGYTNGPAFFSDIAGQQIDSFSHNNMVPFFRGSMKQSIEPNANQQILENFSGKDTYRMEKKPVEPMFKPTADLGYVYGVPPQADKVLDRYIPSIYRQNEVPVDPIYVGPGLNQGYTANPIGGFQQFDIQEYALPKTTDEIRTLDNPKITYESRATGAPKGIVTNRGLQGEVNKNRPDTYYIQGKDRYLVTTGAYLKPELYGKWDAKETARQNSISYEGAAGPAATYVESLRPAVRKTRNLNFKQDWKRNANLEIYGEGDKWNYSKDSYCARPNERQNYEDKYFVTNLTTTVKAIIAPLLDWFRTTRKENVIDNPNKVGFFGRAAPPKLRVHDPNDVARTTIKETNVHNSYNGNMGVPRMKGPAYDPNDVAKTTIKETNIHNSHNGYLNSGAKKGKAYDPNDVARTTVKETNIHNSHNGYLNSGARKGKAYDPNDIARTTVKETNIHNSHNGYLNSGARKGKAYDPNDVARTTVKETNIHNSHNGYLNSGARKGKAYDPNDVARTTVKETNIHNNHNGYMKSVVQKRKAYDPNDVAKTTIKETSIHNNHNGYMQSGAKKGKAYDPNDIARTTVKETSIHNNREGNVGSTTLQNGDGYITAEYQAPNTNRQFTSDYEYTGVADGNALAGPGDGYLTAEYQAPNTNRQFTSDWEWEGPAKDYLEQPMDEAMWSNMRLNETKTGVSEGRYPTLSNTKLAIGGVDINMEVKKLEGDYVNQYASASTRIYSEIPTLNTCTVTTEKDQLPNEPLIDRISAETLDAFRENPYTQPLNSFF